MNFKPLFSGGGDLQLDLPELSEEASISNDLPPGLPELPE